MKNLELFYGDICCITSFTNSSSKLSFVTWSDDVDAVVCRVGCDVVSLTEVAKVSGVGELSCRVSLETSQLGQVEHLKTVTWRLGNNVGVIVDHFHVSPVWRKGAKMKNNIRLLSAQSCCLLSDWYTDWVRKIPMTSGLLGSVIRTNDDPWVIPMMT